MGLNQWLAKCATQRAHVFIAEIPGNWTLRAATQKLIAARGWLQAVSPAESDILAVCGAAADDDQYVELIDRIWDQLPGPRIRVDIRDVSELSSELDHAAGMLTDVRHQRTDACERERSAEPASQHAAGSEDHHHGIATGHGDSTDRDASETNRRGHDASGQEGTAGHVSGGSHHHMDHGGGLPQGNADLRHPSQASPESADHEDGERGTHGGHDMAHGGHHMDHGGMDMAPAGIALAKGGEDRDGLEMDELHVRLGPFLAYWPAGLVMRCTLQGDVITAAEAQMMDAASDEQQLQSPARSWLEAARHTDHVVDLLVLAGWPRAAARARRLREVLIEDPVDVRAAQQHADALATLLRRSRVLRWALRDLAPVAVDDIHQYGLPAQLAGDTYDRLLTRIDVVQRLIRHEVDVPQLHMLWSANGNVLSAFIENLDIATARLVIAGLGIGTSVAKVGQHG